MYSVKPIFHYLIYVLFVFALFNCQSETNNSTNNTIKQDCENTVNVQFIHSLAKEILSNHDSKTIWNLSSVDTAEMKIFEDYFVSAAHKSKLIILQGEAGISAGNANKFCMIISCQNDKIHLDWFGQEGELLDENFRDLDGDGIKEIIVEKSMMWMGECIDNYEILNFQSGERNVHFATRSYSVIECGGEDLQFFKKGDTLAIQIENKIIAQDQAFIVKQKRFIKIHNGGESYEAVVKNMIERTDERYIHFSPTNSPI